MSGSSTKREGIAVMDKNKQWWK